MSAQTEKITADEMIDSLTGFDELAIEKKFGADVETLSAGKYLRLLRALCFVQFKRAGANDAEAYIAAMNLTLKECNEKFADDEGLDLGEGVTPSA